MGKVTKLDLLHLLGHHGHYFESACYHLEGVPHAGLCSPGFSHSSAMRGLFGQRVRHSTKALSLMLFLALVSVSFQVLVLLRRAGPSGLLLLPLPPLGLRHLPSARRA